MNQYSLLKDDIHFLEKLSRTSEYDFLIIGSGAGGGLSAYKLGKKGYKVLVLEAGPFVPTSQVSLDEAKAYPKIYQEAAARKTRDGAINILQGRVVGGSTTVNWTSCFRTPDYTLKAWQEDYGLKELTGENLAPHFEDIEKLIKVSPWEIPPNRNNEILKQGLTALGHEAKVISRNVSGCQNLGYCGLACPTGAKQSSWRALLSQSPNVTILSDAFAERLLHRGERVEGVKVFPRGRVTQGLIFRGRRVILSGGAINSPALLMRSHLKHSSMLGKRTFLHPVVLSGAISDDQVEPYYGAPQTLYSDSLMEASYPEERAGFKLEVPPIHPLLLASVLPFHSDFHREIMEKLPQMHAMIALQRDGFHPESSGGEVELASNGLPILDYPIKSYHERAFRKALLVMGEAQFAAGMKEVLPIHRHAQKVRTSRELKQMVKNLSMKANDVTVVSAHVMGGCLMGSSTEQSVVDTNGRYHQLQNLFVFDGSLFPTSIGTNPMISIYGLVGYLLEKNFNKASL